PRVGGYDKVWINGLYESFIIILVFPLIIYLGAIGQVKDSLSEKVCTFLGDISYPLYITHFPFVYVYSAWAVNNKKTFMEGVPLALLVIAGSVVIALAALKLYDLPVRRALARRFLNAERR
ncbi:MAG: acyltransferase family protein, partial [Bacteroidota bacterium]